jgi:hypothetical protein
MFTIGDRLDLVENLESLYIRFVLAVDTAEEVDEVLGVFETLVADWRQPLDRHHDGASCPLPLGDSRMSDPVCDRCDRPRPDADTTP